MQVSQSRRFTSLLILAPLLACSGIVDPGPHRELGYILWDGEEEAHVWVPSSALAGEPFSVQFQTYGLNLCWSKGTAEARVLGSEAVVSAYDLRSDREHCMDVLQGFQHSVQVTFEVPGNAEIVIKGRDSDTHDEVAFSYPVIVERP